MTENPGILTKIYEFVVWKFMKISLEGVRGPPEARHFLLFHYVKGALKPGKIQYFYQKCIYK